MKKDFFNSLPFVFNKFAKKSLGRIKDDTLKVIVPMRRLLQGDVGSGKTLVGALAHYMHMKMIGKLQYYVQPKY